MNTEKSSRAVVKRARCRSIRIRIGGRIMLMTWRPRVRMAGLLCALLRRSWRGVFGGIAALSFAVPAGAAPVAVNALPAGATVVAGQAVVSQSGNRMNIVQGSANAILNWSSFNIGSAAAVTFQQPDAASATLNRVTGNDPSALLGTMKANGKVWLINQAGIMVGQGAKIDVAGFVASTMTVRDDDFLANRLNFRATPGAGTVQNAGVIATHDGGSVYLVGAGVENSGLINAPGGEVLLAAGQSVQLLNTGTPGVKVEITGAEGSVTNLGQILSDAGRIGMVGVLVKNSGVLNASSVRKDGGRIFLEASDHLTLDGASRIEASGVHGGEIGVVANFAVLDGSMVTAGSQGGRIDASAGVLLQTGRLDVSGGQGGAIALQADHLLQAGELLAGGTSGSGGSIAASGQTAFVQPASARVDASGSTSGGAIDLRSPQGTALFSGQMAASGSAGGRIALTGDQVVLAAATADAHGTEAGGTVLVGGDAHGADAAVQNAQKTTVNSASVIDVSAGERGNGGKAVVWSAAQTIFGGAIAARGGSAGGDGGFVEVSGKDALSFGGRVDANASRGKPGTLLLDPKNIVIDASSGSASGSQYATLAGYPWYGSVTELSNGNLVVGVPNDSFGGVNAGAAYLYNGSNGALISALYGQAGNNVGGQVTTLTNGNYVLINGWTNGAGVVSGAATWVSGTLGVSGAISAANSLVGDGISEVTALSNGNYVVASPSWANGAVAAVGAVTWGNGSNGIRGVISASNSLVGSQTDDHVGDGGVTSLTNGNYLVTSNLWANGAATAAGSVTFGNGATGVIGAVSAANSLVGSQQNDRVGGNGVTELSNSNYVVGSSYWANGAATNAGAATWGSGTTGVTGAVAAVNSLVGSQPGDGVGKLIVALSNGNYVVGSAQWTNSNVGLFPIVSPIRAFRALSSRSVVTDSFSSGFGTGAGVGAATWGDGTTGITGAVSQTNSLVGTHSGDAVGTSITALANGNYVVSIPNWTNGFATSAGAVTWGSGATGIQGAVSVANSLVGSQSNDSVGNGYIAALNNGNYVVSNPFWANGATPNAGAVTWGNGATGIVGAVAATNSLVGSHTYDYVSNGGIASLSNGNYVVITHTWNNGAGAATWGSGTSGVTGVVSAANSLVGSQSNESVGGSGVIALNNGNYVVSSTGWPNGAAVGAGAATWGNGTTGIAGVVSAANSLVGTEPNESVGYTIALANGNYVVESVSSAHGTAAKTGAVTWANGTSGISGLISAANSLVGSQTNGAVGGNTVALSDGNYVIGSPFWGANGATTWVNGTTGYIGGITAANSLLAGQGSPYSIITALSNGKYTVRNPYYLGGAVTLVQAGGSQNLPAQGAPQSYGQTPGADVTITPAAITAITNTGTALVLQANNDITLAAGSDIVSNNPSGNGGNLTLQAGRSIVLNSSIATGNGNLVLVANDSAANGVISAYRDAGAARISTAALTSLDAGTGSVTIDMRDRAGRANNTVGEIALGGSVTANSVLVRGAPITLLGGASLAASAVSGDSIVLDAGSGDFNNGSGSATPFSLMGSARSLVYTADSATTVLGGMADKPVYGKTFGSYSPGMVTQRGNRVLYANAGTPYSVTVNNVSHNYGDVNPLLSLVAIGAAALAGDKITGSAALSTSAGAASNVGVYPIDAVIGSLVSDYNLGFTFVPGALTITPRPITVSAGAKNMNYGGAVPALTRTISTGNLVNGDTLKGNLTTVASSSASIGVYPINLGSLTAGGNYTLSYVGSDVTIGPRPLTIIAQTQSKVYGDGDPVLAFSSGALVNGDTLAGSLARTAGENVGSYGITQGSLTAGSNYAITYTGNPLIVTPATLLVTANNQSRIYGNANPALTSTASGFKLSDTAGSVLSGSLTTTAGGASNIGDYPITQGSLSANPNYVVNFGNGNMAIAARALSVVAAPEAKVYGDADPVLAFTSGALVNGDTLGGSLARTAGVNVGFYDITQGSLSAGPNYAISFAGNVLAVAPRPLDVVAAPQFKVAGYPDPMFGYGVGPLLNGDTLTGRLARRGGEDTGIYAITQGGLSAGPNYALRFTGNTLTVTPVFYVLMPSGAGVGFGDQLPGPQSLASMGMSGPGVRAGEGQLTLTDPSGSAGGGIGEFGGAAGTAEVRAGDAIGVPAHIAMPRVLPRCTLLIGQR